jgi:Domain of unknown function (DUF5615)
MRLCLDAHVSARRIATALREQHDVRAADEERELDGSDDERLLARAGEQGRIMVTSTSRTSPGSSPKGPQPQSHTAAAYSSSESTTPSSGSSRD